ncbi:MAG: hypothetical protein BWX54_02270 [Verrucomicrobia bacterium ADurb.Bin018]|jgi:hypothetical protein|nr:MAG: hypothetical protein BWX54_02270 [Verrucomicrobia bacterium ADurb.Bin018]
MRIKTTAMINFLVWTFLVQNVQAQILHHDTLVSIINPANKYLHCWAFVV